MKEEKGLSAKTIYGVFMTIFYLSLAVVLVFTSVLNELLPHEVIRIILGVLFFIYSAFRGYRIWIDFRS